MRLKTTLGLTTIALLPFLIASCSSDDSSPAAGAYTINTTGGLGGSNSGSGGNGNQIRAYKQTGKGDIEALSSGAANANFNVDTLTVNLGSNPLAITANTTIAILGGTPAAGTPYMTSGSGYIYISDGDTVLAENSEVVTGISVAAGTTLTLALNNTSNVQVSLGNDVDNRGTITTADVDAVDRGDLYLYPNSYVGATGSTITTAGTLESQNGGEIYISTNSVIINRGDMSSRGSNGGAVTTVNGGSGGSISLYADKNQNTGNMDSRGGDATDATGSGGNGGQIRIEANYSYMHNSGNLTSTGGNGPAGGGNGNSIRLDSYANDLLNSGDINSSGGSSTLNNAGDANYVRLRAYGGDLINSGDIMAMGGNTTEPASNGGRGEYINFYVYDAYINNSGIPAGDLLISGNLDTSGGDAVATGTGSGGDAGQVYAEIGYDNANITGNQRLALMGYTSFTTSGGDGNYGGSAGNYQIQNDYGYDDALDMYVTSGNVNSRVNLTARGGNVAATPTDITANGGRGGYFSLETDDYYGYLDTQKNRITNSATADLSGGESLDSTDSNANSSGNTWFFGYNGVTNSAVITANGGNDRAATSLTDGYGGYSNGIEMYAEQGPVSNNASLTANGGNGEYLGGNGGYIGLYAPTVNSSGSLTVNGGNATASLVNSQGGYGGDIELYSPNGLPRVSQSGTVSHTAGTGEYQAPWMDGSFVKGFVCISGYCSNNS